MQEKAVFIGRLENEDQSAVFLTLAFAYMYKLTSKLFFCSVLRWLEIKAIFWGFRGMAGLYIHCVYNDLNINL